MDRRQTKTRKAIMMAFCQLLNEKDFEKISVIEITNLADIGKSTFYLHFEAKELLILELCKDFFNHLIKKDEYNKDLYLLDILVHLLVHINDNGNNKHILRLIKSDNEIFNRYFYEYLENIFKNYVNSNDENSNDENLPSTEFLLNHVSNSFISAIKYSIVNNINGSNEKIVKDYLYCNKKLLKEYSMFYQK